MASLLFYKKQYSILTWAKYSCVVWSFGEITILNYHLFGLIVGREYLSVK